MLNPETTLVLAQSGQLSELHMCLLTFLLTYFMSRGAFFLYVSRYQLIPETSCVPTYDSLPFILAFFITRVTCFRLEDPAQTATAASAVRAPFLPTGICRLRRVAQGWEVKPRDGPPALQSDGKSRSVPGLESARGPGGGGFSRRLKR